MSEVFHSSGTALKTSLAALLVVLPLSSGLKDGAFAGIVREKLEYEDNSYLLFHVTGESNFDILCITGEIMHNRANF